MQQFFKQSTLDANRVSEIPLLYDEKDEGLLSLPAKNGLKTTTADDIYFIFRNHWNMDQIKSRTDYMVLYFRHQKVLGISLEAIGEKDAVTVNTKKQIERIKAWNVTGIATAYNHSGEELYLRPSKTSLRLFVHSCEIFESLGIHYHDHMILSAIEGYYYSFRTVGLL